MTHLVQSSEWRRVSRDHWRRAIIDPAFFAKRFLNVSLHRGQRTWLDNACRSQNALVTGNRWGKSFVSAIRALHYALFQIRDRRYDKPGRYRVVCGSISQDQSGIIWRDVVRLARGSKIIEPLIAEITRTPFPKFVLGNGSSIESRSTSNRGEYLLGNDYDLFIFDEVAFDPSAEHVVNEVILMRLADRHGQLDLVSTPNGKNWLYRKVHEMQNLKNAYVQFGDSRENTNLAQDFLQERIESFSADRIAQNIMGQFVDSGREIIPGEFINVALTKSDGRNCNYDPQLTYITGWDLARKRTATVGVTVSVDKDRFIRVVDVERFTQFNWNAIFEKIRNRRRKYPGRTVIDATGLGDVVINELADINPIPFIFTEKTKAALLTHLELIHTRKSIGYDRWEIRSKDGTMWALEDELRGATWDDNNDCDGLMALALAVWPLSDSAKAPLINARIETL